MLIPPIVLKWFDLITVTETMISFFLPRRFLYHVVCYIPSKCCLSLEFFQEVPFMWSVIYRWYYNNMCSFSMIFFCFLPIITLFLKYIPLTILSIYCFSIGIIIFWFWYTIDSQKIIIVILTFEYFGFWWISRQRYDFSWISQCNSFSSVYSVTILLTSFCMVPISHCNHFSLPCNKQNPLKQSPFPLGKKNIQSYDGMPSIFWFIHCSLLSFSVSCMGFCTKCSVMTLPVLIETFMSSFVIRLFFIIEVIHG